jgi:antitoxin MazE
MKTSIIRIGNSRGIRIPKALLEQCRLRGTVELEVQNDHLVVRPVAKARSGWENAFCRMAQQGDDALLDPESWPRTQWDETEWEW